MTSGPTERAALVTDEQVEQFWADGVVCLRGVISPNWLERLAPAVERAIAGAETGDLSAMAEALGGDDVETGSGRFYGGVDHWRVDDDFRAFAFDSPLPAVAAALLRSAAVWLYEDSVLVKEPGSALETHFHTDAGYFHVRGDQLCTFWVPLDPTTAANGTLEFVRGSHRFADDYRPHLFVTRDALPGTEGAEVPDVRSDPDLAARLISFDLEPGDLTVHHARTLHGAPGNTTATTRRRAVSVRLCGDDARYRLRPGAPRKPHQQAVADGDPLGGDDCPQLWP